MTPNIRSILLDAIDRGIKFGLMTKDAGWDDERLTQSLLERIWFQIDLYFDFDETTV